MLGNILQNMALLPYSLERNMMTTYAHLADMISCAYRVFDPQLYLDDTFVHGNLSASWIELELEGKASGNTIPADALELKQVIDEIVYRTGAAAHSKPQKLRVNVRDDSVTFTNEDGGFDAFAEGSAPRKMCERIYGRSRMSFSGKKGQPITTIALSIAQQPLPPGVFPAGIALVP